MSQDGEDESFVFLRRRLFRLLVRRGLFRGPGAEDGDESVLADRNTRVHPRRRRRGGSSSSLSSRRHTRLEQDNLDILVPLELGLERTDPRFGRFTRDQIDLVQHDQQLVRPSLLRGRVLALEDGVFEKRRAEGGRVPGVDQFDADVCAVKGGLDGREEGIDEVGRRGAGVLFDWGGDGLGGDRVDGDPSVELDDPRVLLVFVV